MPSRHLSPHRRFFIRPSRRNISKHNQPVYPTYPLDPFNYFGPYTPGCKYSDNMSSITPPSFVDDGSSFTKRIPHGLNPKHIANWINSTGSETSAYTGSFVDDGADMLLPSNGGPGFGQIDPRFYKQKKRKEGKEGVWNEDMQKAITGDMQRHLAKMRGMANLEVKRADTGDKGEKKDTVTIPMPPKWGTFVIKAENGRVIVVDQDGEFDSGPQLASHAQPSRWVKAASTIEPPSEMDIPTPPSPPKHRTALHASKERTKERSKDKDEKHVRSHKHKKSHHKHLSPPVKPLTPIAESEYEDGYQPSGGEDVLSPTGFFMTGGASGWPATSIASPSLPAPQKPHSTTSPIKPYSPIHSPPGSWPSPPQSPVKSAAASEQSWGGGGYENAWEVDRSQRSHKSEKSRSERSHRSSKQDFDNVSTKTYSTYRPPAVEDAPDTSSEEKRGYAEGGWGGSRKDSEKSRAEHEEERHIGWGGSAKGVSEQSWEDNSKIGGKSWKGSEKATDNQSWAGSRAASEQQWVGSVTRPVSENSWDGYERVKTVSEVSVVGSGSERSSLDSRASTHHGMKASNRHSQTSRRSGPSRKSSRPGSQIDWGGSQASQQSWSSEKARVDDGGWGGSQKKSEDGWGGSKRGSVKSWKESIAGSDTGTGRYANGYDEDNETYLNENWGGTPVRVASRRASVVGWD